MSDRTPPDEITEILRDVNAGKPGAVDALMNKVYATLHSIARSYMRREREGCVLQATAVVNEAYLRLFGRNPVQASDRVQFFQAAANAMRRVLIDHARNANALKRGGGAQVTLHEWMAINDDTHTTAIDMSAALARLKKLDPRQEKIMDLFINAGRSTTEIAQYLGIAKRTVEREKSSAEVFLRNALRTQSRGFGT